MSSGVSNGKSLTQAQKDGIVLSLLSMVEPSYLSFVLDLKFDLLFGEGEKAVVVQFYIIKLQMDPSISIENQKISLQLKYLLTLKDLTSWEQTLSVLNRLPPFTQYPLSKLPPLQLIEYQPGELITHNLKQLLKSYALILVLGKVRAQKNIYYVDQQRLVDDSIRDKLVYNFDQELTELRVLNNQVTLLKVHKIWLKMAKQQKQKKQKEYIRHKLLKIPFFNKLSFEQFDKILKVATLNTIGPGQTLLQQCSIPYHLYVVMEGQLVIHKKVKFSAQHQVWNQLRYSLQKMNQFSEQLFEYLVREPKQKSETFSIVFQIKVLGQGAMLCGTQTLNQVPLPFQISSSLKTKYISIKYPDLYILQQSRLSQIRNWPTHEIDKRQLRRQYYYQRNWEEYKRYLMSQQQLTELQARKFQDFLRKQEVNLAIKKYPFSSSKFGEGYIIDSPAGKMNRVREMVYFQK